ncbi:MAG: UDP-N-acetylmuramoyl-tripeptide--D-alanyl-D-alanine ligase, partial [Planctomycetes bacterium]|nr:UDP-N-acetylmuramoyl-tripeptide--D-alanyl-D-alanine ligase [Planctomycetota bacterium]
MKKLSTTSLAEIIKASPTECTDATITGVSIDSRTTKSGDCFFAILGENFDGHDYISDAFAKGAACVVASRNNAENILKVENPTKALGDLARWYRQQNNFKVIAITGSVGKTTVRHITHHVLSQYFRVTQSPKNFNNDIGLPLTLLQADPKDQIVIAELGTNCPGDIDYLTRIALPDIALITNVYPAHLERLHDIQTITQEKLSITNGMKPDGTLIINANCQRLLEVCKNKNLKFSTFGDFPVEDTPIELPLPGPGNIENAFAAWAICNRFEITIDDFAKAMKTLPTLPMRAELLQTGTLTIINDCYNANPASMKNALNILDNLDTDKNRRLVFICGDMAELGTQTEKLHTELGETIADTSVSLLMTVGDHAKIAADTAKKKNPNNLTIKCFKDTLSACNNL